MTIEDFKKNFIAERMEASIESFTAKALKYFLHPGAAGSVQGGRIPSRMSSSDTCAYHQGIIAF